MRARTPAKPRTPPKEESFSESFDSLEDGKNPNKKQNEDFQTKIEEIKKATKQENVVAI